MKKSEERVRLTTSTHSTIGRLARTNVVFEIMFPVINLALDVKSKLSETHAAPSISYDDMLWLG